MKGKGHVSWDPKPLVDLLQSRLVALAAEREHVLSLLRFHGVEEAKPSVRKQQDAPPADRKSNPFAARKNGPTERLLAVIGATPGMVYNEVVDAAIVGLVSESANPKGSVGSVLGTLVKSGKVVKIDGRYYLPGAEPK
jgi:hypothetical protein